MIIKKQLVIAIIIFLILTFKPREIRYGTPKYHNAIPKFYIPYSTRPILLI